jgi:hypothetical protein
MARLNAILLGHQRTGWVFRQRQGGRFTKSTFLSPQGIWRPIRKKFGRPDLAFHELRHMAGHYFYVTLGMTDADVAYQLGHRDGGRLVRELYGHGDHGALDRLRRAFDKPTAIEDARQRREGSARWPTSPASCQAGAASRQSPTPRRLVDPTTAHCYAAPFRPRGRGGHRFELQRDKHWKIAPL